MKLPRYPKYKESGVEWLGEVPEQWTVHSLRHLLDSIFNGLTTDQVEDGENTVPVTRIETISKGVIDWNRVGYIPVDNARPDRRLVHGDILFSNINSLNMIGNCAQYNDAKPLYAGMNLLVLRPCKFVNSSWLFWLIKAPIFRQEVESLAKPAINQASISQSSICGISTATPTLEEQDTIAIFLDQEIIKIDALVEAQQRLIELLKEKRQAVISHAVTKGLNPDAPMKDSGIEWLGEVPEHWDVKRIKYAIRKLEQGWSPQCENFPAEDGEWAVLKVGCVNGGSFNPDENKALPPELTPIPELGIRAGDVLISRANTRELAGSTAVAKLDYPRLLLCDKLYRLRLYLKMCLPEYLGMFLSTPSARGEIELSATGASNSMVNIGQSTITEILMPLPPVGEQERITTFVRNETGMTDQLIVAAARAIDLLQERRTALISAAVTGKIDVRGLSGTEAA